MFQRSFIHPFLACILLSTCLSVNGFQLGDPISIMVNKVSPFTNPTQSYRYNALPFCMPKEIIIYPATLGESLTGNSKISSVYNAKFGNNVRDVQACKVDITDRQVKTLRAAVRQNFVFEMFVEDIPVGNALGYVRDDQVFLNTHLNFLIYYNKQQGKIISASVNFEEGPRSTEITDGEAKKITYTYSVVWLETLSNFQAYPLGLDSFFVNESHKLSFLNAVLINIALISIVGTILQRVKKTDGNYLPLENELEKKDSDLSWRAVRLEVLVSPWCPNLLSSIIGIGLQLTITIISLLLLGELGLFENKRGSIIVAAIVIYILTSYISGSFAGKFFRYFGVKNKLLNSILTAFYFPLLVLSSTIISSIFAWKGSLSVSFSVNNVLCMFCLLIFAVLPLTLLGALLQPKKIKEALFENERISKLTRFKYNTGYNKISIAMIALGGLFSFSALHFELFYLFSAIWARKIYTMYGSFLGVFIITMSISALTSISLTYLQLNKKDYRWWWKSFLYGGSCGFYVFLYAIYFYLVKSHLYGTVQLLYYFSYSAIFAIVAIVTYGTAGFIGTSAFVNHVYERHKVD